MASWPLNGHRRGLQRKKIFVIASEGEVTEPQYFQRLNSMSDTCTFYVIENFGNGSDPRHVLDRMKNYLRRNPLENGDEAWLVIDQDDWPKEELTRLKNWANGTNHFCAISIRKFESWLRLHVVGEKADEKRYHNFLHGINKHLPEDFITKERVIKAISTAKRLASTRASVGNVYELVGRFLA